MNAIDRLNESNSRNSRDKYKDDYIEAIDTIDGLIRRISRMSRQVSYLCICDVIKFTCTNGVEFHLEAGKVVPTSDETKFRLWCTGKPGDKRTLYEEKCSWRRDEWIDGVAETLLNKIIEINSDQEEIISNILCMGDRIDSVDFYYFNFINEVVGHAGYSFIKEDHYRYTDCFFARDHRMRGSNEASDDELKTIAFIDMLNKVSIASSIRYKDKVFRDSNILFSIKNGINTIYISLDDCKTLELIIKARNGKVIEQVDLSNYIYCQSLKEVFVELDRMCILCKLDSSFYYSLLALDEEGKNIKFDDYINYIEVLFKETMEKVGKLFVD